MAEPLRFDGRVVLVTGAGGGEAGVRVCVRAWVGGGVAAGPCERAARPRAQWPAGSSCAPAEREAGAGGGARSAVPAATNGRCCFPSGL